MTELALIVGSGFAELGFPVLTRSPTKTPYGEPSSAVLTLGIGGTRVPCIARHGEGHTYAPHEIIYRAISVVLLSIAFVFVVALGIEIFAGTPFVNTTFEAISAFATVGLTTGITPELPDPARLLVTFAMFAGRLGPLTLVLALAAQRRPVSYRPAVESLRIG